MYKFALIVALALPTIACVGITPKRSEPSYEPAYPLLAPPPPAQPGGLYQAGYGLDLYDDRRATRPGDIVTIILQERTR
jgi:flagellar L-ring protein precursor FlgH